MEKINLISDEDQFWLAYERIKAKPLPTCLVNFIPLREYKKPHEFIPINLREIA